MKIMNAHTMLQQADKQGYALPALNANGATYDIARAILEAAAELRSPIIIQAYSPNLEYRGYEYFTLLVQHLAQGLDIPVCISLDHGKSVDDIMRAVRAGFTHVMFDYANRPVAENIQKTNEVIELVRPLGISVEAEIGDIFIGKEGEKGAPVTNEADVRRFVAETDVDFLAVGVGTTHGLFEKQDTIDFDHIKKLRALTDTPLVLHGTCGVSTEDISHCVKNGMRKINFGEGLRMRYIQYLAEYTESLDHQHHAWRIMQAAKDKLKEYAKELICAVGSDGKID